MLGRQRRCRHRRGFLLLCPATTASFFPDIRYVHCLGVHVFPHQQAPENAGAERRPFHISGPLRSGRVHAVHAGWRFSRRHLKPALARLCGGALANLWVAVSSTSGSIGRHVDRRDQLFGCELGLQGAGSGWCPAASSSSTATTSLTSPSSAAPLPSVRRSDSSAARQTGRWRANVRAVPGDDAELDT